METIGGQAVILLLLLLTLPRIMCKEAWCSPATPSLTIPTNPRWPDNPNQPKGPAANMESCYMAGWLQN
jgi:hypothetical protein